MEVFKIGNGTLDATITNYGARLMSLIVPDALGIKKDIVWGFPTPEEYKEADELYYGATIGRMANRISGASFKINGEKYQLEPNDFPNHLHGGKNGFHNRIWEVIGQGVDFVTMFLHSPSGEGGYPGCLDIQVKYRITENNGLKISYQAQADRNTPINLAHHSYFNFTGSESWDILQHILKINADYYTPIHESGIPDGSFKNVGNTPFDFRSQKFIGAQIDSDHPQIKMGKGYDHNFVLKKENSSEIILAAEAFEPLSGRMMQVWTNQPGLQFYTSNFLSGKDVGKNGKSYTARSAFCLETQHFPDSPNKPHFPSCFISPDESYNYSCEYRFTHL